MLLGTTLIPQLSSLFG
ncbi:hypothetical protein [Blautia intestinalis]